MLKHCAQLLRGIRRSLPVELHSAVGRRWCQYDLCGAQVDIWIPKQNPTPPPTHRVEGEAHNSSARRWPLGFIYARQLLFHSSSFSPFKLSDSQILGHQIWKCVKMQILGFLRKRFPLCKSGVGSHNSHLNKTQIILPQMGPSHILNSIVTSGFP